MSTQLFWITLDLIKMDSPGLKEFLEINSPYVRRLTVASGVEEGEIQPILSQLPLIEHLEISAEIKFSSPEPIILENLKCLHINESCVDILPKIKNTKNIAEFSIKDLKMDGKFAKVAQFLMRCPALKKLTVWIEQPKPQVLSQMFDENGLSVNMPFRLKFLEVRGFHSLMYEPNIMKFLDVHAPTLEHLDICHQRYLMGEEVCRHVMTQLPKLKTFKVNGGALNLEESDFICMEPLRCVTDLTVMLEIPEHKKSRAFYALFPSLEKLTVDPHLSYFPKFFNTLNKFHPKLVYLSYSSFRKGTPTNLEFRNLRYLAVNEVKHKPALMNFVMSHRDLVEIIIGQVSELTDDDFSDILSLPALRHLEVAGSQTDVKRIFDLIKKNYRRLQFCKFSYKTDPEPSHTHHKDVMFPLEKKYWKPESYEKFFSTA